ncbi:MAG TPA: hypothetical protein VGX68_17750 [Thermoanaerobaculia bacterium]|jgi:hypothetical protein|nr:hypothetical protein [Thermoanaerobaculia bacterium]
MGDEVSRTLADRACARAPAGCSRTPRTRLPPGGACTTMEDEIRPVTQATGQISARVPFTTL